MAYISIIAITTHQYLRIIDHNEALNSPVAFLVTAIINTWINTRSRSNQFIYVLTIVPMNHGKDVKEHM